MILLPKRNFAIVNALPAHKRDLWLEGLRCKSDRDKRLQPVVVTSFSIAGKLPSNPAADPSKRADRYLSAVLSMAMRYYLDGDVSNGCKAIRSIYLWTDLYRPSFNPIDESRLEKLFLAIDFIACRNRIAGRALVRRYLLKKLARGYLRKVENISALNDVEKHDNWQAHRIKIATLAAYITGDWDVVSRLKKHFQIHLDRAIEPGGVIIDFRRRDAVHYVVYALEPLLVAALAASHHGHDWYSYTNDKGSGLRDSAAWLERYASGEVKHLEFVNSTEPFDTVRQKAGLQNFSGEFRREEAWYAMSLAGRLDPKFSRWQAIGAPIWLRLASGGSVRCVMLGG